MLRPSATTRGNIIFTTSPNKETFEIQEGQQTSFTIDLIPDDDLLLTYLTYLGNTIDLQLELVEPLSSPFNFGNKTPPPKQGDQTQPSQQTPSPTITRTVTEQRAVSWMFILKLSVVVSVIGIALLFYTVLSRRHRMKEN